MYRKPSPAVKCPDRSQRKTYASLRVLRVLLSAATLVCERPFYESTAGKSVAFGTSFSALRIDRRFVVAPERGRRLPQNSIRQSCPSIRVEWSSNDEQTPRVTQLPLALAKRLCDISRRAYLRRLRTKEEGTQGASLASPIETSIAMVNRSAPWPASTKEKP